MHSSSRTKLRIVVAIGALALASGCSSIQNSRGYLVDEVLVASVQPGLDNRQSVEGTLGRPTLVSQFGEPIWYYISSRTNQTPFTTPRISSHSVLAVRFDDAGNVVSAERTGMEHVVRLDPESDSTPTLGRDTDLLSDLFGNIGTVGSGLPGG